MEDDSIEWVDAKEIDGVVQRVCAAPRATWKRACTRNKRKERDEGGDAIP